jgi:septum formation protein
MLVLASQSPRRAELLNQIGIPFNQNAIDLDETPLKNEKPELYVLRMALEKANLGWQLGVKSNQVLAADTIVVIQGDILGKPKDQTDSKRMLTMLSGSTHQVFTAVALVDSTEQKSVVVQTEVCFGSLTEQQMHWYWHTGEPQDKAGSYAIQGLGGQFVKHIKGSYSAVVGLPLYETKTLLTEFGVVNEC